MGMPREAAPGDTDSLTPITEPIASPPEVSA